MEVYYTYKTDGRIIYPGHGLELTDIIIATINEKRIIRLYIKFRCQSKLISLNIFVNRYYF